MTSGDQVVSAPKPDPVGLWELAKAERNWLVYRLVAREGKKPQKIPQTRDGRNIGAKDAAALTFDEATKTADRLGADFGIGYLPRPGSAMVCVDFDGVLKDGEVIQPDLPEISSYAEVSPSGTGLHVLIGRPDELTPLTFDDGNDWVGYIGSDSKFFTVSLKHWNEVTEITNDNKLVAWVVDHHAMAVHSSPSTNKWWDQDGSKLNGSKHRGQNGHWFNWLPIDQKVTCAEEMLSFLPPEYVKGYDTWLKTGMALKLADEGYQLFEVWDRWSSRADNYDGCTMEKWDQLAAEQNGEKLMVTMGTVAHWAKDHGWNSTNWEHLSSNHKSKKAAAKLKCLGAELPGHPEVPPIVQSGPRERARELVTTYAYHPAGDTAVQIDGLDPQQQVKIGAFKHQNERWARRLNQENAPPNANAGVINPVSFWLNDPLLVQIDGLAYRPDKPFPLFSENGKLLKNYFAMPEHKAEGGELGPFIDFMRGFVPDRREREWLLDHLAFKVQNPHLPQVGVVFVSEEGRTGRGTLADIFQKLFHPRNAGLIDAERLLGRNSQSAFKGDFATKIVLFCEELPSVGEETQTEHHRTYNKLKELVDTRPKREKLAVKYGRPVEMYTCTSYFFATNNPDALPLPEYDKRFVVLQNGPQRPHEFWVSIRAWMSHPANIGALFHYLMERDVSSYRHTEIIETNARRRMISETKYTSEQVTEDIIADVESYIGGRPELISFEAVVERARREDASMNGRKGSNRVRKALEKLGYCNVPHADGFGDERGRIRVSINGLASSIKRHTVLSLNGTGQYVGSEADLDDIKAAIAVFEKTTRTTMNELTLQDKARLAGSKLKAVSKK
jgi:Primase C terminal 2 (PriCT-2)/Family of unknown function (DUF5906)